MVETEDTRAVRMVGTGGELHHGRQKTRELICIICTIAATILVGEQMSGELNLQISQLQQMRSYTTREKRHKS